METWTPEDATLRELAVKRLKKKSDFRTHLMIYVMVNTFLVVIWAMTGSGYFWPVFPIVGWGIGVVANAWDVYGGGDTPTEGQINREIERLTKRQ
ncbi:2TM domain-containing protein [Nocardioides sp.]|uniref:2TM domain-containing protein n=1 Tax=Nocardioides sp. TaxID=35761 RepID=UPI002734BE76|nr:2TM domain-containing protein [Nocardioides sp.]MDP3892693.1 2TM domain-containing protein [Nocardioides sp.]